LSPDRVLGGLRVEAGGGLAGEAFGCLGDVVLGGEHGGGGVDLVAGPGDAEEGDQRLSAITAVDRRFEVLDGVAVELGGVAI
jgi:hypothetical protein